SYRYSATAHVALLNDDGAGYSFTWNTANPNQFNGNGFLNIRSHDTWEGPNTGTALGGTIGGAAPPTGYALPEPYDPANGSPTNPLDYASDAPFLGFVKVTLTWDAATGDLSLYMNAALLATRNDTTHDEFTRVYI